MTNSESSAQMVTRLRSLTLEDAADVLEDAKVSDPLTPDDVLAFYHSMLARVIGEEA